MAFLSTSLVVQLLHNNEKKVVNVPPPTPPKLPFLGHLHLLGSHPHRSLWNLSKEHGPIMLLKLGSVPTVIISSAAVARELFKHHDLASCSRPRLTGSGRFSYNFQDLNLSPYGERWRELRKIFILELFSTKRVQSFQHIREEEVGKLLKIISNSASLGTPIDLSQTIYTLTANITFRIAFGKSFSGGELDNENFQHIIRRAMVALGSFSATDFFPGVGWIIDRLSGVHGILEKSFAEVDAIFQQVVDDRIKFMEISPNEENIVDVLLRMERDSSEFGTVKFTQDRVKALIMVT
ncbi:unnamed protein product [Citrullus colocynthis]|uniref:Cytochrome P450 n=1 Tax=Citrullus colocynthis TaxID=252529 RepID=A0ABP0Y7U5_9ROSI